MKTTCTSRQTAISTSPTGTDRHRRSERARVSPALERRAAAPGGQRALPQRHHPQQDQHARLPRSHALAADLAAAADGRGTLSKTGVAIQLSGGHAGPDGIEADEEGGLAVCHLGVGIWRFDSNCLPTHLVDAGKEHRLMTNIAYGGRSAARLYISDFAERRDPHRRDAGARERKCSRINEGALHEASPHPPFFIFAFALPATAQQYPTKPVRLLVGYAAGSSTDIVGRVDGGPSRRLLEADGNRRERGGAAGNLAADAVAKAQGDGYTLLFAQNGLAISAAAVPNLPYSAERDLVPLAPVAATPHILIVGPDFPAKNVQELIARAKAEPGKLTFAPPESAIPITCAGSCST